MGREVRRRLLWMPELLATIERTAGIPIAGGSPMKKTDTREIFGCNECGEQWVWTGETACPFCNSSNTEPVIQEDKPIEPSNVGEQGGGNVAD
jgi:hypothetical protein